jgi:hypothetical protein
MKSLTRLQIPYYFKFKTHIFQISSHWKIEVHLKFTELFTSLQTVHKVAWNEPNINTFRVSHQATYPPPPTFNCESSPNFPFRHCLIFLSFRCVHFSISFYWWKSVLHMMLHSKEKLFCVLKRQVIVHEVGRKYAVGETCVRHWWSIKTRLFSCLTNTKFFSGPSKGRNPENDASVLEYFKDLWNKWLPVPREALMSKTKECTGNSNIPFRANCGWCEKFMRTESLLLWWTKISQKLPLEFETKLIEFQHFVIGLSQRNKFF